MRMFKKMAIQKRPMASPQVEMFLLILGQSANADHLTIVRSLC